MACNIHSFVFDFGVLFFNGKVPEIITTLVDLISKRRQDF